MTEAQSPLRPLLRGTLISLSILGFVMFFIAAIYMIALQSSAGTSGSIAMFSLGLGLLSLGITRKYLA